MPFRKHFPATYWICRLITGKAACRIYASLLVLLLIAAIAPRVRAIILARRIHKVLSVLQNMRIDETSENELLKTVPYLGRRSPDFKRGTTVEHSYSIVISNEDDWRWLTKLPHAIKTPLALACLGLPDWMGYRYMRFSAWIRIFEGKVSSVSFGIAPQLGFPRPASEIVSVKSIHGFWMEHSYPFRVDSLEDENPQFRVQTYNHPSSVNVTYAFDAPRQLISHAFDVDLSCFWSLRGCRSAPKMLPQIAHERDLTGSAADSRIAGDSPCPARIVEGRARYLLDLRVLLLEVTNTGKRQREEPAYRVKEVIRGPATRTFPSNVHWTPTIPLPTNPRKEIPNPVSQPQPGNEVLFFGGDFFDSCQFVPATGPLLAVARATTPAPKRIEDEIVLGLL